MQSSPAFGISFAFAIEMNHWAGIPFFFLFVFGFPYVRGLCLRHGAR